VLVIREMQPKIREFTNEMGTTCKLFTRVTGLSSLRLKATIPEWSDPSFLVREARVTLEDSSS
jgi:hypothetical protein